MKPSSEFDRYNHTELLQTCQLAGLTVSPSEPRERLIDYLECRAEPPPLKEIDHTFHAWRHGLINFLLDYWKQIETQITCPARALKDTTNPNPRPCFGCIDTKVVDCLVENKSHLNLIAQHKLARNKAK